MGFIKLNLFLNVCGRRADGRHDLQHLCVPFAGPDVVRVSIRNVIPAQAGSQLEGAEGDVIELSGPYAYQIADVPFEQNFAGKAVNVFRSKTNTNQKYRIQIIKNTPAGSGLGAGSYNAAETLWQINELSGLNKPISELCAWAEEVASEVPLCVANVPMLVEGAGEKLTPVSGLPNFYPVIVWPAVPAPTGTVFSEFAKSPVYDSPIHHCEPAQQARQSIFDYVMSGHNRLTDSAIAICPPIRDALDVISKTDGVTLVRMTGAGSSCFGLYETPEAQRAAYEKLVALCPPDWWVYAPQP